MQNHENKFELLVREACGALGLPYLELRDKYGNYPICLAEYIERGVREQVIGVRFESWESAISLSFDRESGICDASYIYFNHQTDEDLFIEDLNENAGYDFRLGCWTVAGCCLKTEPSAHATVFCVYSL